MARYRVTLQRPSVEIIEADNPFMAAVVAAGRFGDGVQVVNVRPALGRVATAAKKTKKAAVKKTRTLSPEARAKLAKNLEKARAARARNVRAAKKATRKRKPTKKR
jgi:hypothetical protein